MHFRELIFSKKCWRFSQGSSSRPFFFGATPEIIASAVAAVRARYPSNGICWFRGYFRQNQENEVVEEIRNSGADCLFLGMPAPRKERFLAAHHHILGVSFILGVAGSFGVIADHAKRASHWIQKLGLEWLYRVYQEPCRICWRYHKTNNDIRRHDHWRLCSWHVARSNRRVAFRMSKHFLVLFGTRPEAIKLFPVINRMKSEPRRPGNCLRDSATSPDARSSSETYGYCSRTSILI